MTIKNYNYSHMKSVFLIGFIFGFAFHTSAQTYIYQRVSINGKMVKAEGVVIISDSLIEIRDNINTVRYRLEDSYCEGDGCDHIISDKNLKNNLSLSSYVNPYFNYNNPEGVCLSVSTLEKGQKVWKNWIFYLIKVKQEFH